MTSLTNSNDKENLALALRVSQLSSDEFDEQIAQLPPEGSASASQIYRLRTTASDENGDLAPALGLPLLPSPLLGRDEQVARLHRAGSASASENARSTTPPNESDGDDPKLALILPQPPANIVNDQGPNQPRESRTTIEGRPASLPAAMSLVKV
jgi:hypothetical protein